jgi:hypothetical protein
MPIPSRQSGRSSLCQLEGYRVRNVLLDQGLLAEQVAAANGYGCHASCCAGDHASRSRG